MKKGNLIVGLDVGTTKTCAVVGEVHPVRKSQDSLFSNRVRKTEGDSLSNNIDDLGVGIIAVGSAPSRGVKRGVVVNIEGTAESIKMAVEEAEAMAGIEIKAVYAGIAGERVSSFSSHGVIAIEEREISQREIDKVIHAAKTMAIPFDKEVLHVVPVSFTVDGQNGVNDPRGMSGVRLEANVRIITESATSVQNLVKSCQRAGLDVIDIVLDPFASAEATLCLEEKDLGVGIIDIGGGTTDIVLFHEGNPCYTAVLNVGGNNFTNDIAIGLRMPASEAEKIKRSHGCSLMSMVKQDEEIEITYSGDRPSRKIPRQYLIEVLQPRAEELFYLVKEEIVKSGFYGIMTSGIVLTGGAALMQGMDVMAENILELPVRVGGPRCIRGITDVVGYPVYSTGIGLVLYGAKEIMAEYRFNNGKMLGGVITRVKKWTREVFKF
jgi:cell division protein FtsA